MCNLNIGQKVTLARDFESLVRAKAPTDGIILPEMGVVYTVRAMHDDFGYPVILLEEIRNELRFYCDVLMVAEQGFDPKRFRPVVSRNTDISLFQAMLTDTKTKVPA